MFAGLVALGYKYFFFKSSDYKIDGRIPPFIILCVIKYESNTSTDRLTEREGRERETNKKRRKILK